MFSLPITPLKSNRSPVNKGCKEQCVKPTRWHHEIYLSDPRRVPPEKLKTLLRFPVMEG